MKSAREINPETWVPKESAVLCFIRDKTENTVLLIHKKRGLGAGLVNAPGGRIEKGESPAEAAVRETEEEVGITVEVSDLVHAGDLFFQFTDGHSIRGYVFYTYKWEGVEKETSEADPFWCREGDIPYDNMWTDDSWWLPHLLGGRYFRGRFIFSAEKMLSMSLDIESGSNGSPIPKGALYEQNNL